MLIYSNRYGTYLVDRGTPFSEIVRRRRSWVGGDDLIPPGSRHGLNQEKFASNTITKMEIKQVKKVLLSRC